MHLPTTTASRREINATAVHDEDLQAGNELRGLFMACSAVVVNKPLRHPGVLVQVRLQWLVVCHLLTMAFLGSYARKVISKT